MDLNTDFVWISRRLEFHEGCVLTPYRCPAGKLTIGVGRNLEDNPLNEKERRALGDYEHGITHNGAMMLLRNDVERCLKDLKTLECWRSLSIERRYALLDMCFQLGFRGLCKFERMLKALEEKNYHLASIHCLDSKYAKDTPARAKRIANTIKNGLWLR
jgi:lysozyme